MKRKVWTLNEFVKSLSSLVDWLFSEPAEAAGLMYVYLYENGLLK